MNLIVYYFIHDIICLNKTGQKCNYTLMEEHALKNANNCLNANIFSYLGTSGGQSSNLNLNVVHCFQH